MQHGKKELAEQIIRYATSVEVDGGEVRLCTESSRCGHDTNRLGVTQGLSGCTASPSVPFPAVTKASGCLSTPI